MHNEFDKYDYEFAVLEEDLKTEKKIIDRGEDNKLQESKLQDNKLQENIEDKKDTVPLRVERLVEKAKNSLKGMKELDQDQINHIVKEMALAGLANHMRLAKLAVEETNKGVYEDKIIKNLFATEYIYHSIKYIKTVGIIDENPEEDYYEIAEPVGVIAGITPVTNPTSTTLFNV